MTVTQFFDFILNLIFPNVCGMCNKISKKSICDDCLNQIVIYKDNKKINKFKDLKIKLNSDIYFDEQMYFYKYQGEIRDKLIQYKFGDKPYLYKMFSEMIYNKNLIEFCRNYNVIIPVPIDMKRMKQRGYNQTELIAKEIQNKLKSESIELEFVNNVLYKTKNRKPQSTMETKQDRIENIRDVYDICNSEKIKNKNVIILDDIFTTGSTVNECAMVIKQCGTNKIGIITIARD